MDDTTFSDLLALAESRGLTRHWLEEQVNQGWLRAGTGWALRTLDVLIDAKERQGFRGDGLRFWLWLHAGIPLDQPLAGRPTGEAVRAFVEEMETFQLERLRKITQFNPGGRPRKDGKKTGAGKYAKKRDGQVIIDVDAIDSYDDELGAGRAKKLDGLMNDVGYQTVDLFEPFAYRLFGVPINPELHRRMGKLYVANAALVPIDLFQDDVEYVRQHAADIGDPDYLPRLQQGEPGRWDIPRLLNRATPEDWENARRRLFTPPALLYISFAEAVAEASQVRPVLQRQFEFFRHPRLAIRAAALGLDLCEELRRRGIAERRARRQEVGKGP